MTEEYIVQYEEGTPEKSYKEIKFTVNDSRLVTIEGYVKLTTGAIYIHDWKKFFEAVEKVNKYLGKME